MTDLRSAIQELVFRLSGPPQTFGSQSTVRVLDGPLSQGQEDFWLMDQVDPNSRKCLLPEVIRLVGQLDVVAIRKAFETVVARHGVLRSEFTLTESGDLRQFVREESPLLFRYQDIRGQIQVGWLQVVNKELASMANASFNLERGETLRISLIRIRDDEYILTYVVHHIVFDEASFAIMKSELSEFYEAAIRKLKTTLKPLKIDYVDYAIEQRVRRAKSKPRTHEYWNKRLKGLQRISIDEQNTGSVISSPGGSELYLDLGAGLVGWVGDIARRCGVTRFMVYLSGYILLLSKLSRSNDIAVSTPVSNRHHVDLDSLIGYFVDTVAIRVRTDWNETFAELVSIVTATCLEAFEYQDITLSELFTITDDASPRVGPSSLNHSFIYQHEPSRNYVFDRVKTEVLRVEVAYAKGDFALTVRDGGVDPFLRLQFDRTLYNASTALHMGHKYMDLLRIATTSPNAPISTYREAPSSYPATTGGKIAALLPVGKVETYGAEPKIDRTEEANNHDSGAN